ncbi:MAG: FAD-binding oxidoreductase [bacterium]|nr:FAD-binding oxidoreductase [bacterium]
MASYLTDWRGVFTGDALAVVRPRTTDEVARVVQACAHHGVAIVPQGGNTGLAAGATPLGLERAIVLALERMRAIRTLDREGFTIGVDAGCVLADVQRAAEEAGRLFPLALAAEGSAQIGGLIATNAGGTAVLRYGSMRALVLGLEAVLPDGRVVDGLRALRKDNAGYDWKQLFVGSEGTLGVITAAVLRLFPRNRATATALVALDDLDAALALFGMLQDALGETLAACELFSERCLELQLAHAPQRERPLPRHPWYLLIEAGSSLPGLRDALEAALAEALEREIAAEAVLAESSAQRDALWLWRESITESERREGASAKHDVSVALSSIPAFVREATSAVEASFAGARVLAFGHVGDGNVHFNVLLPPDGSASSEEINALVHGIVRRFRGSITAEHGIGRYRRDELSSHRSESELSLMRAIKTAVDPDGRMNPGALF